MSSNLTSLKNESNMNVAAPWCLSTEANAAKVLRWCDQCSLTLINLTKKKLKRQGIKQAMYSSYAYFEQNLLCMQWKKTQKVAIAQVTEFRNKQVLRESWIDIHFERNVCTRPCFEGTKWGANDDKVPDMLPDKVNGRHPPTRITDRTASIRHVTYHG